MESLKISIPQGKQKLVPALNQSICLSKSSNPDTLICTGMTPAQASSLLSPSLTMQSKMLLSPTHEAHMTPLGLTPTQMHVTATPTISEDAKQSTSYSFSMNSNPLTEPLSDHSSHLSPIVDLEKEDTADPFEEHLICSNSNALLVTPKASTQLSYDVDLVGDRQPTCNLDDISPEPSPELELELKSKRKDTLEEPMNDNESMMTSPLYMNRGDSGNSSMSPSPPPPRRRLQLRPSNVALPPRNGSNCGSHSGHNPVHGPNSEQNGVGPVDMALSPLKIVVTPCTTGTSTGCLPLTLIPHDDPDSENESKSMSQSEDDGFVMMTHSDPEDDDLASKVKKQSPQSIRMTALNDDEDKEEEEEEEEEESEYDSEDEYEESSSMPLDMLFGLSAQCDEEILFAENGYKKVDKICDTLQGELFKAQIFRETNHNHRIGVGKFVAIKRIDKSLRKQGIAEKDDMAYCVEENVEKEAKILKHLTVDNTPTGKDVARFVDYFESDDHLYLVTEFVDGCTLAQFVKKAHGYIENEQLDRDVYRKCIKSVMWQMVTTISWLHRIFHCCHMDLCLDNIMVHNVNWKQRSNGKMSINPNLKVKVVDFGVAEIFETPRADSGRFKFQCDKEGLNVETEALQAPESSVGVYDARALDMWSIGMIFYEAMVGEPLYEAEDKFMWDDESKEDNGFWAVTNRKLREYMARHNFLSNFKRDAFDLLEGLLTVKVSKRLTAKKAEKHIWFQSFYKRSFYGSRDTRKHNNWLDHKDRVSYPYYSL